MSLLNRLILLKKELVEFFQISFEPSADEIIVANKIENLKSNNKNNHILLIPLINDTAYMNMTLNFVSINNTSNDYNVKYYFVQTGVEQPIQKDKMFAFFHFLKKRKEQYFRLLNIYNINKKDVLFSNFFLHFSKPKTISFNSKKNVLLQSEQNILYGDLVYDTYLRYRGEATINLNSKCLYDITDYAKRMIEKQLKVFSKYNSIEILTPYTSYLSWGIAARVALKYNHKVLTYGSNNYILSKLENEYPYHSKNYWLYKKLFKLLTKNDQYLQIANNKLQQRLHGVVDQSVSYMTKSAYHSDVNSTIEIFDKSKKFGVIFLHCFFDSPHIYGDGLFPDFYDWIQFLLKIASANSNVNYYIKPHPNGLKDNEAILINLKDDFNEFDNIHFLDKNVSNKYISQSKPDAVFTYYGTVAHEFAFLKIPVVTAGDNPHSLYDFIYKPESIKKFKELIENIGQYGLPKNYSTNEILEFYFMHFMYYSKEFNMINFEMNKNFNNGQIEINTIPENNNIIYNN